MWSCGAALPNSLVDLLDTGDREEEEEEEEENEVECDFDDFSEIDCEWWSNTYRLKPMRGRGAAAKKISFRLAIYLDQ